ncbi:MAG: hypothetical protein M0Z33_08500 [Actinomycetota bacterium]|nr:hypothetical protein [Actinomycetota bacterium]
MADTGSPLPSWSSSENSTRSTSPGPTAWGATSPMPDTATSVTRATARAAPSPSPSTLAGTRQSKRTCSRRCVRRATVRAEREIRTSSHAPRTIATSAAQSGSGRAGRTEAVPSARHTTDRASAAPSTSTTRRRPRARHPAVSAPAFGVTLNVVRDGTNAHRRARVKISEVSSV